MTVRVHRQAFVAIAAVISSACFATRGDVRTLQADIAAFQAYQARTDSSRRAQVQAVAAQVAAASDSLRAINAFLARFSLDVSRFQGDLATTMHSFGQQLIAVQEQMGQSQKRLEGLRADFETRASELAASAVPTAPGGAPTGAPVTGPRQLLQTAQSLLLERKFVSARMGFEDFLQQFPSHENASMALLGVGRTYDEAGNAVAADSVYQLVVQRYPASDDAPNALYKRAMIARLAKPPQATKARELLQEIVTKYPKSGIAELAADRLKSPQ